MRVKIGLISLLLHSVWVGGLGYVGYRNHDLQFAWATQESLDFPIGLLAESFRSLLLTGTNGNPLMSFNSANILFFLFAGGIQFFLWGYLLGLVGSYLVKKMVTRS